MKDANSKRAVGNVLAGCDLKAAPTARKAKPDAKREAAISLLRFSPEKEREGVARISEFFSLLPSNGTRTHPLSKTALAVLGSLARGPVPCQEINPGVVNRLRRENLTKLIEIESPYRTRVGKVNALEITEAGRERLDTARTAKE